MDIGGYSSVEKWLGRLRAEDTRVRYRRALERWFLWVNEGGGLLAGLTLDELVEYQKKNGGYVVLDSVQNYVSELNGLRRGYKNLIYSCLRSFFLHNRAPLPQDRAFSVVGDVPQVVGGLTVEEVRRVLDSCNECYRAMFLCMFQGGMGLNEVKYWSDTGGDDLQEQIRQGRHPIRISLPGRKRARNKRPYYTFIGHDGVNALRIWMKVRPRGAASIFVNQFGRSIDEAVARTYWNRKLVRLGIIEKPEIVNASTRYGKNPHELRDLFRSRFQKSRADPLAAEFFMGHIVDRNSYNKAFQDIDYSEEQYSIAEAWLNIVSDDPEKIPRREVTQLHLRMRELESGQNSEVENLRSQMDLMRKEMRRDREILELLYNQLKK